MGARGVELSGPGGSRSLAIDSARPNVNFRGAIASLPFDFKPTGMRDCSAVLYTRAFGTPGGYIPLRRTARGIFPLSYLCDFHTLSHGHAAKTLCVRRRRDRCRTMPGCSPTTHDTKMKNNSCKRSCNTSINFWSFEKYGTVLVLYTPHASSTSWQSAEAGGAHF